MELPRFAGAWWPASVLAVWVSFALPPPAVTAQAVDVSGAWTLEVETDQGTTTPSWVLDQDGTVLTGAYTSATLGENRIRGTVEGSDVMITFSATLQGQSIPVEYRGTVGDDGVIRGTIDVAGGMMQGRFTATRRDG